jgi:HAE1 family hydrophobic/amphiphilic exporter-1
MTTATTIFGLLPMAIDKSEGSNLWNPLAITVIGGLLFATPLTLVLVPAIYSIFEQFGHVITRVLNIREMVHLASKFPAVAVKTVKNIPKILPFRKK